MGRVAGKVAFVAGAGGGIGGAAAEALAREGAAVFCTDRDGSAAEETAARIRAAGGRAAASALDVCDRGAIDRAVAAVVREFGRLDIVLESAGISHRLNFLDLDPDTTRANYTDPEARRATEAVIPLGRLGQPDDLVGAVLFLASDESRWVTGSTVTMDGGVGFRAELLVLGYERQQPGQSDFHHRVLWSIGMASESAGSPPAPRSLIYSPTAQIAGALRASGRKLPGSGWRAIGECGRSVGWTCQSSVPVAASAHPAR